MGGCGRDTGTRCARREELANIQQSGEAGFWSFHERLVRLRRFSNMPIESKANKSETVDFLIVGSGAGAMSAALAARAGGMSVLIVEKLTYVGGSTGFSGGVMWLPNNPTAKRAGVEDSFDLARRYMDAVIGDVGPASSTARRDAFVRNVPHVIDFLERSGMQFVSNRWCDYYDDKAGGLRFGRSIHAQLFNINELGDWASRLSIYDLNTLPLHAIETFDLALIKRTWKGKAAALRLAARVAADFLTGRRRRGMGAALQGRMLQLCLRAGVSVRTETAVNSFVVENGRVVGVTAMHKGRELVLRAIKGVLVNAGGFSRDQAMRDEYQRKPNSAEWTNVSPGDTGEAIRAAIRVGAAVDLMDQAWWVPTSLHRDGAFPSGTRGPKVEKLPFMQSYDIAKPHGILVDQSGVRYFNEAVSYMEQGTRMYDRNSSVAAVPSWHIMDSRHRQRYFWGPSAPNKTPKEWLESGYMKKADTLDGLASLCNIDATTLVKTVQRFNSMADKGIDQDFHRGENFYSRFIGDPTHKPNPSLGSIERAPYYAVAIFPADVGTCGGMLTDEHARVVRKDGSAIDGLYAVGNCTASVMGKSYLGAGASLGPALVFAWLAVRHACDPAPDSLVSSRERATADA